MNNSNNGGRLPPHKKRKVYDNSNSADTCSEASTSTESDSSRNDLPLKAEAKQDASSSSHKASAPTNNNSNPAAVSSSSSSFETPNNSDTGNSNNNDKGGSSDTKSSEDDTKASSSKLPARVRGVRADGKKFVGKNSLTESELIEAKNALKTKSSTALTEKDKREQRRAANRLSAFQSRQRRKEIIEELQKTVARITQDQIQTANRCKQLEDDLVSVKQENEKLKRLLATYKTSTPLDQDSVLDTLSTNSHTPVVQQQHQRQHSKALPRPDLPSAPSFSSHKSLDVPVPQQRELASASRDASVTSQAMPQDNTSNGNQLLSFLQSIGAGSHSSVPSQQNTFQEQAPLLRTSASTPSVSGTSNPSLSNFQLLQQLVNAQQTMNAQQHATPIYSLPQTHQALSNDNRNNVATAGGGGGGNNSASGSFDAIGNEAMLMNLLGNLSNAMKIQLKNTQATQQSNATTSTSQNVSPSDDNNSNGNSHGSNNNNNNNNNGNMSRHHHHHQNNNNSNNSTTAGGSLNIQQQIALLKSLQQSHQETRR